jgi:hypothetical protein
MSKITAPLIASILIILLSVLFYLSPKFFAKETAGGEEALKEITIKRFIGVGNSIAHAAFIEDAIIMGNKAQLNEIITNLCQDEPEMTFIHFTDSKNKVIASSNDDIVDKTYESDILASGTSIVKERNGIYEGGFSVQIGKKQVGAFYFEAKPKMSAITVSDAKNPIILGVGIIIALFAFIITFSTSKNLEKKLVKEINKRQEEVYAPKIEELKKQQDDAQVKLDEMNNQIEELNKTYEEKKKEIENSPAFQSVEKLKETEQKLLKKLETLKEQESQLDKEVELLSQKREEIRSALEAEKKEESILHEKLNLIKKKILRLEKP